MFFNPDDHSREADLACELVRIAIENLTTEDRSEMVRGLEECDLHVKPGAVPRITNRINALLRAAGEHEISVIPSIHDAELTWLNHIEPCAFPITLVAKLTGTTARELRRMVAKALPWLHQDADDGLLYGEWQPALSLTDAQIAINAARASAKAELM